MKTIFIIPIVALTTMFTAGAQAEKFTISCNSSGGDVVYYMDENGKNYVMVAHEKQKDGSLKPTLKTNLYVQGSKVQGDGVVLTGVAETQRQVDVFQVEDFEMHYPRYIEKDALVIDFKSRETGKVTTVKMYCSSTL